MRVSRIACGVGFATMWVTCATCVLAQSLPAGVEGNWRITRQRPSKQGRLTGPCAGGTVAPDKSVIGSHVQIKDRTVVWGNYAAENPSPKVSMVDTAEFTRQYLRGGVKLKDLGFASGAKVEVIRLGAPGTLPFDTIVIKDPSTIYFEQCGLFSEAVHDGGFVAPAFTVDIGDEWQYTSCGQNILGGATRSYWKERRSSADRRAMRESGWFGPRVSSRCIAATLNASRASLSFPSCCRMRPRARYARPTWLEDELSSIAFLNSVSARSASAAACWAWCNSSSTADRRTRSSGRSAAHCTPCRIPASSMLIASSASRSAAGRSPRASARRALSEVSAANAWWKGGSSRFSLGSSFDNIASARDQSCWSR